MKIESIELYRVSMPLIYPFRTAYGDGHVIESVLVKISSQGLEGWGEATPWESPLYSSEWAVGAFALVRDWLGPQILGQEIESGDVLQKQLSMFKGNPMAKASLDLAWWDLQAKIQGEPLWRVLGGQNEIVDIGADFGVMENLSSLIEKIQEAVNSGFKRVKLKFRRGWDIEMVRTVREFFPNLVFHVDCNSSYRLDDLDLFLSLDEFGLAMIEQPLAHDDLLDHAELQRQIATPICLDESICSVDRARQAIDIGACQWFNLKPARIGGITPTLKVLSEAKKGNIPCWIGGMLESAVGGNHCIALATLSNMKYPADIFPSRRFYEKDLSFPEVEISGKAQVKPQPGPGIGCTPERSQLEKYLMESHKL